MLDKLKAVADRYEAIVSQLEDSAIYADSGRLAKLTREQKELTPLMEAYEAYRRAGEDMAAAQAELETREYEVSAGGGVVKVKINGRREVLNIDIDPEIIPVVTKKPLSAFA